jgi:hypothetical protein
MRYVKCWTVAPRILFTAGCRIERARDVQKTVDAAAETTCREEDNQEGRDTSP